MEAQVTLARPSAPAPRLRDRSWPRFLRGPDRAVLDDLYVPALAAAVRYDRCCAYFSSSVLAAAARGFGKLIERLEALGDAAPRPAIRLVVNEELPADDVRALMATGDLSQLEAHLKRRFKTVQESLEKARLQRLAWLVKRGLLDVRVGVMRQTGGILHGKFGIALDEVGEAIIFRGSGNESAQALAGNYEQIEVSTSWGDPEAFAHYTTELDLLWHDRHPDVHTVPLPEALRQQLIKLAPSEPPVVEPVVALARQRAAMLWQFIAEAPYLAHGDAACDATMLVDLWPHQRQVVEDAADAWPQGRLLCDEVGMGKTVEAIAVIRRLIAGRGVRRLLILLPAGLVRQWQAELREKGGLIFPRLEGLNVLTWPDGRTERVAGLAAALERDQLLVSRETVRLEQHQPAVLNAPVWDLVILDEAHAARRREQEEGEFNSATLLLQLLRELQLRRKARGLLLLSATPMQTHPWEPWDLLAVLGEGGRWLAEFSTVRDYYAAIAGVEQGQCDEHIAQRAAATVAADLRIGPPAGASHVPDARDTRAVAQALMLAPERERPLLASWLRRSAPLAQRMHRNTRKTIRRYYELGLVATPPPERDVQDIIFDFQDPSERAVYDAVTTYIDRRFALLEAEKPGKGFVMTVYRRRAASSPAALRCSLERRKEGLQRVIKHMAVDETLAEDEGVDTRDIDDLGELDGSGRISAAYPSTAEAARAELREVEDLLGKLESLHERDSKRDRFVEVLKRLLDDGRSALVFTEYVDTMNYLRDHLVAAYDAALGCYSGEGGQRYDAKEKRWCSATKDQVAKSIQRGELRVLLCTDAASEGLNLQAAGAVINFDLPWNPSRVEQRIGRVDRIGQQLRKVRVVNLFLKESVDEKVYTALRSRCGLFEHFVGALQPVLARARRLLLGQEPFDLAALEAEAQRVEREPLSVETYLESPGEAPHIREAPITLEAMAEALEALTPATGFTVKRKGTSYFVAGEGMKRVALSSLPGDLEREKGIMPLGALSPVVQQLAGALAKRGERLPLVVGAHEEGPFRVSVALWVTDGDAVPVRDYDTFRQLIEAWDGVPASPAAWLAALYQAKEEAQQLVEARRQRAEELEQEALETQRGAARIRLLRELARYVLCLDLHPGDMNQALYQQMRRQTAAASRNAAAFQRLGGRYPTWPADLVAEARAFVAKLSANQRQGRLLGKELDAALNDPRWRATGALG